MNTSRQIHQAITDKSDTHKFRLKKYVLGTGTALSTFIAAYIKSPHSNTRNYHVYNSQDTSPYSCPIRIIVEMRPRKQVTYINILHIFPKLLNSPSIAFSYITLQSSSYSGHKTVGSVNLC
jgi:hypothetical protein